MNPQKILIIQTAFIGDAVLATSVAEELHDAFPSAKIVLLVRKGNELLFEKHPFLCVWTHDKSRKYQSLLSLIKKIRQEKFDIVVNLHRYLSSNLLTILSNAKYKVGFRSFLSHFFTYSIPHRFKKGYHEIDRYHELIQFFTKREKAFLPRLYPPDKFGIYDVFCLTWCFDPIRLDVEKLFKKRFSFDKKYVCMFPGSVWPTKELPPQKWIELIRKFSDDINIYLCGSKQDNTLCEYIKTRVDRENVYNVAGKFNLSEITYIIKHADRVYVNDSAPLHIASALNVPVTAFFCSTTPDLGFYPLSPDSQVIEVQNLECRPCGIHGYKRCPKSHFQCGFNISLDEVKILDE